MKMEDLLSSQQCNEIIENREWVFGPVPYHEACPCHANSMPRSTPALQLKEADDQQLRQWVSAFGTPQQVALGSQIVLAAAAGQSDEPIARGLASEQSTDSPPSKQG